jgi:hypothetical protein
LRCVDVSGLFDPTSKEAIVVRHSGSRFQARAQQRSAGWPPSSHPQDLQWIPALKCSSGVRCLYDRDIWRRLICSVARKFPRNRFNTAIAPPSTPQTSPALPVLVLANHGQSPLCATRKGKRKRERSSPQRKRQRSLHGFDANFQNSSYICFNGDNGVHAS